jgi:hypothetical protein
MRKHHIKERAHDEVEVTDPAPFDPIADQEEDERSLDLVQRMVASALAIVVGGSLALVLAFTAAVNPIGLDEASRIGLWVMAGVTGLLTTAAVLVINRRHPYSPLLAIGLLPMAVAAFWVLV